MNSSRFPLAQSWTSLEGLPSVAPEPLLVDSEVDCTPFPGLRSVRGERQDRMVIRMVGWLMSNLCSYIIFADLVEPKSMSGSKGGLHVRWYHHRAVFPNRHLPVRDDGVQWMSAANFYADDSVVSGRSRAHHRGLRTFEADWNAGRSRLIENEVATASEAIRRRLFRELLSLEVELVRRAGRSVDVGDYLSRFRDQADAVREIFIGPTLAPLSIRRRHGLNRGRKRRPVSLRLRTAPPARRRGSGDDLPGARPRPAATRCPQALSRGRFTRPARGGAQ